MRKCLLSNGQASSRSSSCPRILLCGIDNCHTRHLGPALLHTLEHLPCHVLDVTTLFEETGRAVEETIIQKIKAARHTLPSLLYVPDIMSWWDLVDEAARVVFMSLMRGLDRSVHLLVLTTANSNFTDVPSEISSMYDEHQGEVYEIEPPTLSERQAFFEQLFGNIHENLATNDISNRSSYVDFVPIMAPRRIKIENRKQKSNSSQFVDASSSFDPPEAIGSKKIKTEARTRSKLSAVTPGTSTFGTKTRAATKREHSSAGDDLSPKRQRLPPGVATSKASASSIEKLTEVQIQELLQDIVKSTDHWTSQALESLYASLELTLERTEDDVHLAMTECLQSFCEMEKIHENVTKREE
ncbi:ATPase family AAA domain-containing protein 2-like [Venturia canescens]|uniref:ATPase family AAA domain-containing protein 2-like n=1 Tax=Venturia canescens TaxID=32260 RepID=UPI001C9CD5CD|nr:ATPase family AAA domain-containing protein 2-like [Venturia canescens]